MPLDIPLPTASPDDDPEQYIPLLLSAIEGFLLSRDVWEADDYSEARQYMNQLMVYVVEFMRFDIVRLPIGWIGEYGGATAPEKFLLCNGQAVSRSTYAALFAVIGTNYGAGNGTTTFNVPDFRDRSPMMPGSGNMSGLGVQYGAAAHQLTIGQLPNHDHDYSDPGHFHDHIRAGGGAGSYTNVAGNTLANPVNVAWPTQSKTTGITFHAQGSNQYHNITHPVLGVNMLIFAGV